MTTKTSLALDAESTHQLAYKLLREKQTAKQVESALVAAGVDHTTASDVVQKVTEAQDAAKWGDLGYKVWIKFVFANPFESGFLIGLLSVVTVVFTLVAAVAGLLLFPSGRYPTFILAGPGVIAGLVFFLVLSCIVYLRIRSVRRLNRQTKRAIDRRQYEKQLTETAQLIGLVKSANKQELGNIDKYGKWSKVHDDLVEAVEKSITHPHIGLEKIKKILVDGVNINATNESGRTVLSIASYLEAPYEVRKLLINAGAKE